MQGLSELIETPVLAVSTGKQIGIVEEVVISLEKSLVLGIIVGNAEWFSTPKFIAFEAVFRIGFDAIIVKAENVSESLTSQCLDDDKNCRFKDLQDKQIFSESGLRLGTMADIEFDHFTGELKGYSVSEGIINDFIYGRNKLPLPPAQLVCDDRVIVPESMVKLRQ